MTLKSAFEFFKLKCNIIFPFPSLPPSLPSTTIYSLSKFMASISLIHRITTAIFCNHMWMHICMYIYIFSIIFSMVHNVYSNELLLSFANIFLSWVLELIYTYFIEQCKVIVTLHHLESAWTFITNPSFLHNLELSKIPSGYFKSLNFLLKPLIHVSKGLLCMA